MHRNHLFIPSSFFPSIGGAQGSLLNFISNAEYSGNIYAMVGSRGFLFSFLKKRNFKVIPIPYLVINKFEFLGILILFIYVKILKINIIWFYGGGTFAAKVLKNKYLFKDIKLIVRSCGEDIQNDVKSGYGMNEKDMKLIFKFYKNCDLAWAISKEIEDLYKKKCSIVAEKIIRCPNVIMSRGIDRKFEKKENKRLQVGIIGRYHKKKQFELSLKVAKLATSYDFHFKTPGFNISERNPNIFVNPPSKIKHLLHWPPDDVFSFYNRIDLLLVCSRVESFGNINFEAAVNGVPVLIKKGVTGGDLLKELGYEVFYFNSFNEMEIFRKIEHFDRLRKKSKSKFFRPYDNSFAKRLANIEL